MKMSRLVAALLVACAASAHATPSTPDEIDLGTIEPGAASTAQFEITNDGDFDVAITLLSSDPSLVVEPETVTLGAGQATQLEVRLRAPEGGAADGAIVRLITLLYDRPELESDVIIVRATVPGAPAPAAIATPDDALRVELFMDASCPSCRELARGTLPGLGRRYDRPLAIETYDVMDPAVMSELMGRLERRAIALDELPAAFVAVETGEPLVFQGFEGIEAGVETVLRTGDGVRTEGTGAEGGAVRAFSVGAIVGAGLMDGINPCAFSTMLFLISMLALVGRSRREILLIGSLYSLTVFVGYFAAGLGLFASVRALMVFPVIVQGIRWVLVAMLGVLAILSLRDAWLAHAGRTREMALQLPDKMKRRVHDVVRSGTRSASLVGGTILLGIGVTIFEFSCTGQVYVPVIMHLARTGSGRAVGLLVLYNVAFIVPLLVVFGLAYAGISMKKLGSFFERHVAVVKVGLAVVFAGLAVMTVLV